MVDKLFDLWGLVLVKELGGVMEDGVVKVFVDVVEEFRNIYCGKYYGFWCEEMVFKIDVVFWEVELNYDEEICCWEEFVNVLCRKCEWVSEDFLVVECVF